MPEPDWVAETWAFHTDCDSFEQIALDGDAPSPRSRHATVLDTTRSQMLVHGGRWREGSSGSYDLYDDLWALDLTTDTWSELDVSGGPDARVNHGMVVAGDQLLIYGGNTSTSGASYSPKGDLWSLDLDTLEWTELDENVDPGERLFHAMTVSEDGATVYAYGGGDENAFLGPFFADLWALDVASGDWTELDDGGLGSPDGRIWPNLLHDGERGRLLLWAGHDDGNLGNTNQVWAWDLATADWSEAEKGDTFNNSAFGFCDFPSDFTEPDLDAPERRYAGAAALTGDELIVFGGKTDCGQVNDVWSWTLEGQSWTERSSATFGEICARTFAGECESLCF
jgi:hypothetical protein